MTSISQLPKIEAWPEGRPHCWLASDESIDVFLDAWFAEHDSIHNAIIGQIIIGADWSRDSFQFTHSSPTETEVWQWAIVCVGCDDIWAGHRLIRVEGRKQYVFDIGEITDDGIAVVDPPNESPFAEYHDEAAG